jgi:chemotaxis signal transduction protein
MTAPLSNLAERAVELRTAFDRGFAVPLRAEASAKLDLLGIRVGAEAYALRLSEISGLFADRKFTRVPASNGALVGIAGFRGALVPVYSLHTLLGHSGIQTPRWLVIAAAAPIAIAFDTFEGHLRVSNDAILPRRSHGSNQGFAPELVRTRDVIRPVIHLPSVIRALGAAEAPKTKPTQEE